MHQWTWARRHYRILIVSCLFFLCFTIRARHVQEFSQTPYFTFTYEVVTGPDQNTFFEWAEAISQGSWTFRRLPEGMPFHTAPLYSVAMAAAFRLGASIPQFLLLQAFLSSFLVFLFYGAAKLMRSASVGIFAGLFWCFYGVSAFYDSCLIRASGLASLTFLVFWSFLSSNAKPHVFRWIRTGVILGLLIATRGSLLFLLLPLWIILGKGFAEARQRLIPAFLVLISALVVISPFTWRNYQVSRQFVPVASQGADAIWLGNTSDTLGVSYFPSAKSAELLKESGNSIAKSFPILIREIQKDPAGYLKLYRRKFKMFLNDFEIPANYSFYIFQRIVPVSRVTFLTFIWLLPLSLMGIFFARKSPYYRDLLFFTLVLSFSAISIHIQSRYRFPVVPFLVMLASFGIRGLGLFVINRRWIALLAACLIMGLVMFYQQPLPSYGVLYRTGSDGKCVLNESKIRDVDYITLITAYLFDRETNRQSEINRLTTEGRKLFGKEFMLKFNNGVAMLKQKK